MGAHIMPFAFEGNPIRVLEINSDPWFVAKDVALALGYGNPQDAVRRHCKRAQDVGGAGITHPSDLDPQTKIIPEGDVYRLIVRSNLPSAEKFEALVMDEILPTIRKTGSYGAAAQPDYSDPNVVLGVIGHLKQEAEEAKAMVIAMQPTVDAYDRIAKADGSFNISEAAKSLGMRPKGLFSWLSSNGWIYKRAGSANWLGYQTRANAGDVEHKTTTVLRADGSEKITEQVRVTGQGMTKLAKLIQPIAVRVS